MHMVNKKNTLLYLDTELVRLAKKHDLHISKITEEAIKEELRKRNIKTFDPEEYLNSLLQKEQAIYFPFEIKSIEISNFGPIKHFKTDLDRINVIVGKNATGKTTILKSIYWILSGKGLSNEEIFLNSREKGNIKIELKENIKSINYSFKDKLKRGGEEEVLVIDKELENVQAKKLLQWNCLLVDDALSTLDGKAPDMFLKYLKKQNIQLILTCRNTPKLDKDIKIIKI